MNDKMNDSEEEKMQFVLMSKIARTNGFEGCINYGKECHENGFYLCTYSREGLCDDCELKYFPNRFHGCLGCRRAHRYSWFCHSCSTGLEKWLFNLFYNKNENSKSTSAIYREGDNETNNWNLWQIIKNGVFSLVHKHDKIDVPILFMEKCQFNGEWPGFYQGNKQWFIPIITKDKINISDINWDNKEEILLRELEKNNIFIYKI